MANNTLSPPPPTSSSTALNATIMEQDVCPALTNAVSAWSPLLRRASNPQLDRFAAHLAPLIDALGGRLGGSAAIAAAVQEQDERIKNDWIDLHRALEDARSEVAALEEAAGRRDGEIGRLRGARERLRREVEERYEEGLRVRREACARAVRIEVLEGEVSALRERLERRSGEEDARPTCEEEDEVEERCSAAPQHAAAAVHDDEDGSTPRYVLRATKRRRLEAVGQKPRVRAAFAMLLHGLDDAADNRFVLDDHDLADRQQVHDSIASSSAANNDDDNDDPATPTPPADPVFAEARALLLARLQLEADDGPVYVDMLPARDPVVELMEATVKDLIEGEEGDGGGKAAEQRARRAVRWADGCAGVDYCLGGALRTRRKPNFVDGPRRACKECVSGRRPCLVRDAGSGEVVALPWKGAPEEATWKDVVMWKGDGGVVRSAVAAGAAGRRKRKRRN